MKTEKKTKDGIRIKREFDRSTIKFDNPYTTAFCYPQLGRPFAVRGPLKQVKNYLDSWNKPLLAHIVITSHVFNDEIAKFLTKYSRESYIIVIGLRDGLRGTGTIRRKSKGKSRRYGIRVVDQKNGKILFEKELRRFPRRWMKELNEFAPSLTPDSLEYYDLKEDQAEAEPKEVDVKDDFLMENILHIA